MIEIFRGRYACDQQNILYHLDYVWDLYEVALGYMFCRVGSAQ